MTKRSIPAVPVGKSAWGPVATLPAGNLTQGEAALRWQFWKRFSAVGFAGYGVVRNNLDTLEVHIPAPRVAHASLFTGSPVQTALQNKNGAA